MERKMNAFHKPKSRSTTDLYKVEEDGKVTYAGGKTKSVDEELFELCALSGVKIDIDVFNIVIDLLRSNVNPNTLMDVLRKISSQQQTAKQAMKSSKSTDNISHKNYSRGGSTNGEVKYDVKVEKFDKDHGYKNI